MILEEAVAKSIPSYSWVGIPDLVLVFVLSTQSEVEKVRESPELTVRFLEL